MDDVFAQFQEATQTNRNKHASMSGIRNKAESVAAKHQRLKEHCHDAFNSILHTVVVPTSRNELEKLKNIPHRPTLQRKQIGLLSKRYDFYDHCEQRNYAVVGKYFDVLSWWTEFEHMFPYVFPRAIILISKPAMNTFHDWVFSMLSWFDSNHLMHCQTAKTFEMHVLECIMRKL